MKRELMPEGRAKGGFMAERGTKAGQPGPPATGPVAPTGEVVEGAQVA